MSSLQVDDFFLNQFMGLGNSLKVIVYYLLIGGMISLNHRDGFHIVSAQCI